MLLGALGKKNSRSHPHPLGNCPPLNRSPSDFFCCVRLRVAKRLTLGGPDVVCANNNPLLITNRGSIGAVIDLFTDTTAILK